MKRSFKLLLHAGFWFCYLLLLAIITLTVFRKSENDPRIGWFINSMLVFACLPSTISFYVFYFFIFPNYTRKKKIVLTIIYGLLTIVTAASTASAILYLMGGAVWDVDNEHASYPAQIVFISFIAFVTGVVAIVIKGFITWVDEIKLKDELRQQTHAMEMVLVKSQLDPHFLFNTINNIDVLILKDANLASEYLNKLSDIMRFILYETKPDRILLSQEIEYIKKYLALQKIRTANESYVSFAVSGQTASRTIAPMLFIPFIENAFKHTSNKKLENAIMINIALEKNGIHFVCQNKFTPGIKPTGTGNGLGNELIQKRLNLLYPGTHSLQITNEQGLYLVSLIINHA
jgi:two-component system LytT family sensor kinase